MKHLQLPNGITAIHVPLPGDRRAYAGVVIRTGSRYESTSQMGISHFLEHMMFRGSQAHPTFRQLAESLEWLGGEWNAATGPEHTEYWYLGTISNLTPAIAALAEALENPLFLDMDIERQVILRELQGELNEFGNSTDLAFQSATHMWRGNPISSLILGTEHSINSLTLADLTAYRDRTYIPVNMTVCTVGGEVADVPAYMDQLAKEFSQHRSKFKGSSLERPPSPAAFKGPVSTIVNNTDNEYQVQLSFECEGLWSEKSATYEIITRILGDGFSSRLSCRLREELGLVYDISADTTMYTDVGSLNVTAAVGMDNFKIFLEELLKILCDLAQNGPKPSEVERAIRRTTSDLEILPHDPAGMGFRLAWMVGNQRDPSLALVSNRLQAVTADTVRKTCQELFRRQHTCLIAIGPEDKSTADMMKKVMEQNLPE